MISLQCALCGKKQKIVELYSENFKHKKLTTTTFSARRTPDRLHFRFVKCLNCGLIFSSPILSQKDIEKLYQGSDFDYQVESSFLKKTYGFYLQKILAKKHDKQLTLLDIGCGNGFFLEEAKEMGIKDVYGIEPGKPSVMKAKEWLRKRIKIGFFTSKSYKKNTFDIICCFQTLDHIIEPNAFLKNIFTILKPGGMALFILHNTNGLSVKLFGERSPIFDIEHIYLFNKKNLAALCKKNGFTIVETFDVKNRYPLEYWFRMIPLPETYKNTSINILKKLRLAQTPLSLQAGNIGIIIRK